ESGSCHLGVVDMSRYVDYEANKEKIRIQYNAWYWQPKVFSVGDRPGFSTRSNFEAPNKNNPFYGLSGQDAELKAFGSAINLIAETMVNGINRAAESEFSQLAIQVYSELRPGESVRLTATGFNFSTGKFEHVIKDYDVDRPRIYAQENRIIP